MRSTLGPPRGVTALALVALLTAASAALAQPAAPPPTLTEAVAAYEAGQFERAAALLERAAEADALSRADVVRLLSHRVLVAQALDDDAALDRALLQLVTLEPEGLGAAASPRLQQRTAVTRERTGDATLGLDIEHRVVDGGLEVRARVRGDVGGLVREVSLRARQGGGDWLEQSGGAVVVEPADAVDVEVIAVAVGPGGAPLASVGSERAPHRLVRPAPAAAMTASDEEATGSGDDAVLIGVGVGVAVALVAAAVVLGVVLGTAGQPDSDVMGPVIEW